MDKGGNNQDPERTSPAFMRQFMNGRLAREIRTIHRMIEIYCRDHHREDHLCADCRELCAYAEKRTISCRFGEDKPVCAACPVHCYQREMRKKIREVMRYTGPRLICRHPLLAMGHLLDKVRKTVPPKFPR